MKNNFNRKTQSVNPNNNDTFYVMLNEVVQDYSPKTKLPQNFIETILKENTPIEEGDTVFNGSFNDWYLFIGYIVDQYENLRTEDEIQIDFSQLKIDDFFRPVVVDDFIGGTIKNIEVTDEQIIHITGNKYQIQRFYDLLKMYEYRRTKFISL